MSLYLYQHPHEHSRPLRLPDQHFGLGLHPEDLFSPIISHLRSWRSAASHHDAGSTITFDKDKFQANLDVQQFKPEEITVKATGDNTVIVEGKHEEKQDEHGFISRQFVRKYIIPQGHDVDKIETKLSSDGVLTITAPKVGCKSEGHKSIPIIQTGKPSKAIEEKKEKK